MTLFVIILKRRQDRSPAVLAQPKHDPDPNQVVFVPKPYQLQFKNAFKTFGSDILSLRLW